MAARPCGQLGLTVDDEGSVTAAGGKTAIDMPVQVYQAHAISTYHYRQLTPASGRKRRRHGRQATPMIKVAHRLVDQILERPRAIEIETAAMLWIVARWAMTVAGAAFARLIGAIALWRLANLATDSQTSAMTAGERGCCRPTHGSTSSV